MSEEKWNEGKAGKACTLSRGGRDRINLTRMHKPIKVARLQCGMVGVNCTRTEEEGESEDELDAEEEEEEEERSGET